MEFDPSFPEKIPYLSGIFHEHPCIKSEIPMPEENTTFMYQNNFNHFQYHPLDEPNHDHCANFVTEGSSSVITPLFSLSSSTPSAGDSSSYKPNEFLKGGFANSYYCMPFAPNRAKAEPMHAHPNTDKGIWDFSQKTPFHSGASATSQFQVQRKSTGKIQHKFTNIIKGQWSAEEDRVLVQLVKRFGLKKWSQIARLLNGRVGKQCRERWHNHLRPNIRVSSSSILKDSWNEEEDKILIEAHKEIGNKWAEIARRMPDRTENTIKNHWNATKRRLNAKRQRNKRSTSKGATTLLQSYIRQVTAEEEDEKELKKSMSKMNIKGESSCTTNLGLYRVRYESSEGDFSSSEDWGTQTEEDEVGWRSAQHRVPHGGGYVPVMVNAEEDSSTDYEVAMEMTPEVQMKKEMDLMDMIYRKA
ncbi:Transcription factor MYB118, partial [Mucuna pruriens]